MREDPLAAIRELTEAWIRKDRRGMSRRLSEDIIEIGPAFRRALKGHRNFFKRYQTYFRSPLRINSYRIIRADTVLLAPRLVLVHFTYRMSTRTGRLVEVSRGKESMVLESKRGRWFVKFIHWHRDPM